MPNDLFVGLVTHHASRFADAATEAGLGLSVVRTLRDAGRSVEWLVSAQDAWSPEVLQIDRAEVLGSIRAELDVEARWHAYLTGAEPSPHAKASYAARRWWRTLRNVPRTRRELDAHDPGFRMVRRLVNIELSHLTLMRAAVASAAGWALIVEDDAAARDPGLFAVELLGFMDAAERHPQPVMVSLSESFTPAQLGIEHLLRPVAPKDAGAPWSLWRADRPVTNTVCATLYRADFLAELLTAMEEVPLSPVVPIDFKLNEALMRMADRTHPGDCWIAHPAPLEQRSGVPQV